MRNNRRSKRFRYRSNGRGYQPNRNGSEKRLRPNLSHDGRPRNNFNNNQSAEKLVEKYNILAREALLTGDEIVSENFFQHADHFARIIEQKNLNQSKNKIPPVEQASVSDNKLTKKIEINRVEEIKKK